MKNKLYLVLLLSFLVSSCALFRDLSDLQRPQLSFNNVGFEGFGFNQATLLFTFDVENPNNFRVSAKRYTYDFLIDNNSFISGDQQKQVNIDRGSSSLLEVPVTIRFTDLYRTFSSVLQQDHFDYNLNTEFIFDVPGLGEQSLPVSASGTLPVPKIPRFTFGGFDVNNISLSGAQMDLKFDIENPNAFPISLLGADYSLEVNGRNWLDTTLDNAINLASSGSSEVVIPVRLNASQMGSVLGELISGNADFDYKLTGNANVGAEIEGFQFNDVIPIDISGNFQR